MSEKNESERMAIHPVISSASTAMIFSEGTFGKLDLGDCAVVMLKQAKEVNKGNLESIEEMLLGQSIALNAMFAEFARRASVNMGSNMGAFESYLRLSLKAQAQSRATLQTLAEIKNPRPVAFVKQQNIASGHQQVNNGVIPAPAHTEESESMQNELLEVQHGERLDTRAPGKAIDADPAMATLGEIDRAANP